MFQSNPVLEVFEVFKFWPVILHTADYILKHSLQLYHRTWEYSNSDSYYSKLICHYNELLLYNSYILQYQYFQSISQLLDTGNTLSYMQSCTITQQVILS